MPNDQGGPPFFQRVGESIRAFSKRIEVAFDNTLSRDLLAWKIWRGLTPSIQSHCPRDEHTLYPTYEELMWYGDHLTEYLPPTDAHWHAVDPSGLSDFSITTGPGMVRRIGPASTTLPDPNSIVP